MNKNLNIKLIFLNLIIIYNYFKLKFKFVDYKFI